jgi:four helix bundle protein
MFGFQKLDVYQCAIQFLAVSSKLLEGFPRGHAGLADQLRRAALSTSLNIAEGTGRTSDVEQRRHCAIARGSAMECAAVLDACLVLGLIDDQAKADAQLLLVRIVQMLTKMAL